MTKAAPEKHAPRPASAPETSPAPMSAYVISHCTTCAAGWTRRGVTGGLAVFCLLNREAVWAEMVHCDRYEPRLPGGMPASDMENGHSMPE